MFRVLVKHQEGILKILDEGRALIGTGTRDDAARLARLRWEITRSLRAYQLFKHVEIFDRAIASGTPEDVALARAMKYRCEALSAEFEAYVRRWSSTCILAEWDAYLAAAREMNGRLRTHLVREREEAARLCQSRAAAIRVAATLA